MKNPERDLWAAVITQALTDATRHVNKKNKGGLREQRHARAWLTGGSKDFSHVCALAGVDAVAVRDRALLMEKAGWPELEACDAAA